MERDFEEIYKQYLPLMKSKAKAHTNLIEFEDAMQEQAIVLLNCIKYHDGKIDFRIYLSASIENMFSKIYYYNNASKRKAEVITLDECRI